MKKKLFEKFGTGLLAVLLVILIIAIAYFISWAVTVGIIYLICLCFGIEFKLLIATGIWLIVCILKSIFKNETKVEK